MRGKVRIPEWTRFFSEAEKGAVTWARDFLGRRNDGTEFPFEIGLNPVETDQGKFVLASITDISIRKKHEEELSRKAVELERSNRELDDFAKVVCHDLRSPLNAIKILSEWVDANEGNTLVEESRGHLGQIRGRVDGMQKLMDDILEYSRVGQHTKKVEEVDTSILAKQTFDMLGAPSGFRLVCVDLPKLLACRIPLQQVFLNLIDNSIKHHDAAGQGVIQVMCEGEGENYHFTFSDNGPGIAEKYRSKVFDIFTTLSLEEGGAGIGLPLVKKVIQSQGGKIWVGDASPRGAKFQFTWPKEPVG